MLEEVKERHGGDRKSAGFQAGNISGLKGESRDIIARRVGLGSGRTYEAGKEVVVYMDRNEDHRTIFDGLAMIEAGRASRSATLKLLRYEGNNLDQPVERDEDNTEPRNLRVTNQDKRQVARV